MPAGGLIVAGAVGLGTAIYGAAQKAKYQRQQAALASRRPQYQINPEEANMESLAESRAGQGLSDEARAQLNSNTAQNFAASTGAALRGGADANSIGNIASGTQNAYNQTALYDDQMRLQNLSSLQNEWARMSANRDKQWQINQEEPWKDNMTATNLQLQGANNTIMSGVNAVGSAGAFAAKGLGTNYGGDAGAGSGSGGVGDSSGSSGGLSYGLGAGVGIKPPPTGFNNYSYFPG